MSQSLAPLEDVLSEQNITSAKRGSSEFAAWRFNYISHPAEPLIIARPRTSEEVATIVTFCVSQELDFAVRAGGHDLQGRSTVQDAVTIDLREINYVEISDDERTARIGGGVLLSTVLDELGKRQLSTPVGAIGTVGYVGWATLGGYGGCTPSLGLGLDNIVGARMVDSKGRVLDADASLLKAIRGAGPAFGVIVELSIKIYPFHEVGLPMMRLKMGGFYFQDSDCHDRFKLAKFLLHNLMLQQR